LLYGDTPYVHYTTWATTLQGRDTPLGWRLRGRLRLISPPHAVLRKVPGLSPARLKGALTSAIVGAEWLRFCAYAAAVDRRSSVKRERRVCGTLEALIGTGMLRSTTIDHLHA